MRALRHIGCMMAVALVAMFVPAHAVHADVNDFTITRFAADYTLTNDDKQGRLHVVEHINVLFTDNNHGLLRALPNDYKHHHLQLKVNSIVSKTGAPTAYSTYGSNGNTVLKIGDPDRTVTGQQEYAIDYTLRNVVSFYPDHDELYWDVNGTQWDQVANEVTLTLHLPRNLMLSANQPLCYTGGDGSAAAACTIHYDENAHELATGTTNALYPRQTLSIVAGFQPGYFAPSTWWETAREYQGMVLSFVVPFLLLAGSAAVLWFKKGRDAKGRRTIVPQYDAPEGLSPIEAGTVADFRTDNRDITATIIDLAIRRYITIIEEKKERRFRKDAVTYTLRIENTDVSGLTAFEAKLLKDLQGSATGNEVPLDTLKYKLASTAESLRKKVRNSLKQRGYFRASPEIVSSLGLFGMVVTATVLSGFLLSVFKASGPFAAGVVLGAMTGSIFLSQLSSRTARGVAAKEHLLGLKLYLETAEADRLKKLQSPDAPYMQHPEPKHTVELFEKLLPLAMVLGVEQAWARQFEHIYTTPPDWYSGNWTAFNAGYLASSLTSGVSSAVNTAFSAPSSSSGSGFSGGGAGGGGGGGGGGGW